MPKKVVYKPVSKYDKKFETKITKQEFFSGIINNGVRIIKHNWADNSSKNIYTVPTGKVFYLISASLAIHSDGVAAIGDGLLRVSTDYLIQIGMKNLEGFETASVFFSIPLKFVAGETIIIQSNTTTLVANGQITGYEIDASLLPLFT